MENYRESPHQVTTTQSVRAWWDKRPMTYGTTHGTTKYGTFKTPLGGKTFYEHADDTLYRWNQPLHTAEHKFGKIFDYDHLRGKKVLEIGCGMGCMAMLWAQAGATVTAIDLTPTAVSQTKFRFETYGLAGHIYEMDARSLAFPYDHFEYVYSWGVLHHSPDIHRSIDEIHRVLKPGGKAGVMVYNRESLYYRYMILFRKGILRPFMTELELASRYTDGYLQGGNPYTWPITEAEARTYFKDFKDVTVRRLGEDVPHVFDEMIPKLGTWLLPKKLTDWVGEHWGWGLWIEATK